jgi:dTMP kinase
VPTGKFITFEGGEGAGKSTQIQMLAAHLTAQNLPVTKTREPGGSPGAERIRELLVEGDADQWEPFTETLLHYAARREHLYRTIRPALDRGDYVLCDRFADSTAAYQGHGQGVSTARIEALHELVVDGLEPDLTLILDLPVEEGLHRAETRGESGMRYERMGLAFHNRLREAFLSIARANAARCVVIDASGALDAVGAAIREAVVERFPEVAG